MQRRETTRLPPGSTLNDRYAIERLLGTGGFGSVYQAADTLIGRTVAVKVLDVPDLRPDDPRSDVVLERFAREVRLTGALDHEHIVTIYDVGSTEAGQPFLVMELLVGRDIQQLVTETGPLAPQRAIRFCLQALSALAVAHDKAIVHKDLKPANLFVTNPGTPQEAVKVVDFGTAHVDQQGLARLTRTGHVYGTPQYMAPEYIKSHIVKPTLDVYQMALVLAESMMGEAVVTARNPLDAVMAHGSGEIGVASSLVHGPLGPVLKRALHPDYTKRYANAGEFYDALSQIDAEAISPPTPGEPRARVQSLDTATVSSDDLDHMKTMRWSATDSGPGGLMPPHLATANLSKQQLAALLKKDSGEGVLSQSASLPGSPGSRDTHRDTVLSHPQFAAHRHDQDDGDSHVMIKLAVAGLVAFIVAALTVLAFLVMTGRL